ncbi:HupT [Nitrospirillum viridazoti Y2]|uniref:histidine kinase n=1 Tax=Nitrospirillum amazonense TaxID=28077 RepID=A0A560IRA2_9PROT|nr:ATP-binding protein [Nitrospirillum amazonense]EGX99451.1 HupT [Nitrospirillum amazonense Y2]TWB60629.1 two-component system sensor histidine kinase HupT/HoxJ [Nitrospirillum amazonense]
MGSHEPVPPFGDPPPEAEGEGEQLWIDVIRRMDVVYSDLVASQVALEEQNLRLQQARDFMQSVLGAMNDVLIVCDAAGAVLRVNAALTAALGREEGDLLAIPLLDLFDPADHADIRACLAEGCAIEDKSWHLLAADGQRAAVSVNGAPRRDARGRFAGMVLAGRPVGELLRAYRDLDKAHQRLRQTQQQLLTSEKMAALGRLVAGVAHELNNPISFVFGNMYALKRYGAAITGYLAAIDAGKPRAELAALRDSLRIDKVLADIGPLVDGTLEGAERVRDIVQDLRRFSSNQREEPEAFNLVRLIHTATDWVIKTQRTKPEVRLELPAALEVVGLKGQLHQILVNLVQNAVDAVNGRDGALIRITAGEQDGWIVLTVADNGPGIPPENQSKIFEPFFTTKPIGSGTGLGLYVSYNMAEKLGGSLSHAEAEGGGAAFTLKVPVDDRSI